jgi:hypothetical protein
LSRWRLRSFNPLPRGISYPCTLRLLRTSALDLLRPVRPALLSSRLAHLWPSRVSNPFSPRLLDRTPRGPLLFTLLLFQLARLLPRFSVTSSSFIIEPADFLPAFRIRAGRVAPVAAPVIADFELTFIPFIRDRLNPKPAGYIISKLRLSRHVANKHRSFVELLRDTGR